MSSSDESKKGRPSKAGHRKHKFVRFFAVCEEKKLRRVLRRNGTTAASLLRDYFWDLKFGRTSKHQVNFEASK